MCDVVRVLGRGIIQEGKKKRRSGGGRGELRQRKKYEEGGGDGMEGTPPGQGPQYGAAPGPSAPGSAAVPPASGCRTPSHTATWSHEVAEGGGAGTKRPVPCRVEAARAVSKRPVSLRPSTHVLGPTAGALLLRVSTTRPIPSSSIRCRDCGSCRLLQKPPRALLQAPLLQRAALRC